MLYVDQYGSHVFARTVRELCEKTGYAPGSARRMYCDNKDGKTFHIGYVVGNSWWQAYTPYSQPA